MYSIEAITSDAPFLVFLSLPRATREKLIYTEPFIDKSIRKLVADGSKVAIVSLASVEEALGKEHLDVDAAAKVSSSSSQPTAPHAARARPDAPHCIGVTHTHTHDEVTTRPLFSPPPRRACALAARVCVRVCVVHYAPYRSPLYGTRGGAAPPSCTRPLA